MSDEEESEALAEDFVFVPQLAQFHTKTFRYVCEPQKWQISVIDFDLGERAVEIVGLTFDDRLYETPIRGFGLNATFHRTTKALNVSEVMSRLLSTLPFGFEDEPGCEGKLSFTRPFAKGKLRCDVEPSVRGDDLVYMSFNGHYDIEPNEAKHFKLRDKIDLHLEEVRGEMVKQLDCVVQAINTEAGG